MRIIYAYNAKKSCSFPYRSHLAYVCVWWHLKLSLQTNFQYQIAEQTHKLNENKKIELINFRAFYIYFVLQKNVKFCAKKSWHVWIFTILTEWSREELNKTAYKFSLKCHHKLYRVAAAACVTERFHFYVSFTNFFSRWMVMRILVRVPLLLKAQFLWAFNVDLLPTSLYLFMSFSHACEFMRIIWQNVIILLRSIDIDIHNLFFAPFFSWIIYVCVLSSCLHDSNKKIINFLSVLFCVFLMSSGKATYCNKKKNESLKYNFL